MPHLQLAITRAPASASIPSVLEPPLTSKPASFSALLCAFATNVGFLLKHRGACAAPEVSMGHPVRSAVGLFRSKWFAPGMLVAVGAWVFHVGALALAPLSIVQAVIAGGLVCLTVLAELLGLLGRHSPVGRRRAHRARPGAARRTPPAVGHGLRATRLAGMVAFESALLDARHASWYCRSRSARTSTTA